MLEQDAGVAPSFEAVLGAVAMALRQRAYVIALRQYLRLLAGQAPEGAGSTWPERRWCNHAPAFSHCFDPRQRPRRWIAYSRFEMDNGYV
jgi:hypothetical protein